MNMFLPRLKDVKHEQGGNRWVENNTRSSFHVYDDPNKHYAFIACVDDKK